MIKYAIKRGTRYLLTKNGMIYPHDYGRLSEACLFSSYREAKRCLDLENELKEKVVKIEIREVKS